VADPPQVEAPLVVLADDVPADRWRSTQDGAYGESVEPEVFGLSDIGRSRENNDDRFLVAELRRALVVRHSNFPVHDDRPLGDVAQAHLLAVADGVGGIAGGELASAIAIDTVCAHAVQRMTWPAPDEPATPQAFVDGLRQAIRDAQRRMQQVAAREGLDTRLGTTLTFAYVAGPELLVAHVGDSRAYLLEGRVLYRLTRDHTLAEALRDGGIDVPAEAEQSGPAGVLVNAIGGGSEELAVDVITRPLVPGSVLLLATDGLTRYLDDQELADRLAADDDVPTIVRALVATANERGGDDNITVVVARF